MLFLCVTKGQSRQSLYWEAAPFLTVGEEKLWRQRKELKSCHRDISRLQEELSQSELQERARRTAAENVAESEQQAHDCEKEKREQSLRELLSLQQRLSAAEVDRTSPALVPRLALAPGLVSPRPSSLDEIPALVLRAIVESKDYSEAGQSSEMDDLQLSLPVSA